MHKLRRISKGCKREHRRVPNVCDRSHSLRWCDIEMEPALTSKNTTTTNPQQVSAGGQRLEEELQGPGISHPPDEISIKTKKGLRLDGRRGHACTCAGAADRRGWRTPSQVAGIELNELLLKALLS